MSNESAKRCYFDVYHFILFSFKKIYICQFVNNRLLVYERVYLQVQIHSFISKETNYKHVTWELRLRINI